MGHTPSLHSAPRGGGLAETTCPAWSGVFPQVAVARRRVIGARLARLDMERRPTLAGECYWPIWSASIDVARRGFADQGAEHGARAAGTTCFTNDDGHVSPPTELPKPSGNRLVGRGTKRFKALPVHFPMADHPHTIDRWDDATGENLIEQIAAVGDYLVALATYRAAVKRWPKDKITLRNRARVIEQSWED
jgi:hypothetical protein